jgi:hypothetical protein
MSNCVATVLKSLFNEATINYLMAKVISDIGSLGED